MKVIVFDTETTGLPERNAPFTSTNKWPYIIQLSYALYDISTNNIYINDGYIKIDDNIEISKESQKIHGITKEKLDNEGMNIKYALMQFNNMFCDADLVIGHNLEFDKNMIIVESLRNNIDQYFTYYETKNHKFKKPEYCTMKNTAKFCGIIKTNKLGKEYFKYPKLIELYRRLFPQEKDPKNLHNSLFDILVTLRCYLKYKHDKDLFEINETAKVLYEYCEK